MADKVYSIILRHDTSTKWMTSDPILALGEYGVEDDTHKVKRGDGETKWSALTYEDFGLTYIVTFANLNGAVADNEVLNDALNGKVNASVFTDVDNRVISGLSIVSGTDCIGTITKTTKNISDAGTNKNVLKIVSTDNSLAGTWSIDDAGVRTLNVKTNVIPYDNSTSKLDATNVQAAIDELKAMIDKLKK